MRLGKDPVKAKPYFCSKHPCPNKPSILCCSVSPDESDPHKQGNSIELVDKTALCLSGFKQWNIGFLCHVWSITDNWFPFPLNYHQYVAVWTIGWRRTWTHWAEDLFDWFQWDNLIRIFLSICWNFQLSWILRNKELTRRRRQKARHVINRSLTNLISLIIY